MGKTKLFITGGAGFIGYHLCKLLAADPACEIVCVDNINDYYDPKLKYARLDDLGITPDLFSFGTGVSRVFPNLRFVELDICEKEKIHTLFEEEKFDYVIHLAAQAGVRYSLQNPQAYIDSNVTGFLNILEACRCFPVKHLLFASSSSVYGLNKKTPFSEQDTVDFPASLYAVTKRTNELMAHTYSHLFDIPCTGMRFFTVYGPWGRPDMAYFSFADKITAGEPIDIYNYGNMRRDFTYIDDAVAGIAALIDHLPASISANTSSTARYTVYNIGNHTSVTLIEFVNTLERLLGKTVEKRMLPIQPGDVFETYADIEKIANAISFLPKTSIQEGLQRFVFWYRGFYKS